MRNNHDMEWRSGAWKKRLVHCLVCIALGMVAATLLTGCALDSTTSLVKPGVFTIRSAESDLGSSPQALAWETNRQGTEVCPAGFEQVSYSKKHVGTTTTHITTIRCTK